MGPLFSHRHAQCCYDEGINRLIQSLKEQAILDPQPQEEEVEEAAHPDLEHSSPEGHAGAAPGGRAPCDKDRFL